MYTRNLLKISNKLLEDFPILVILGVRQCGKSSLARALRPNWEYYDLERPSDRDLILGDPELFFKNHPGSLILDEAQIYPELMGTLRGVIDADRSKKNRFLITGSSSPDLLRVASETLAGRVATIELSPLKMNEIYSEPLPEIYKIFDSKLNRESLGFIFQLKSLRSHQDILRAWIWGGFPEPQNRNSNEFYKSWQENYIRTFVERDLKRLFPNIDSESYRVFLSILKDFHANSMNISDISRSLGLGESTIRKYLNIADQSYLWRKLPSFERSHLRSVVKNPRGLYRDSGLFHFMLSIFSPSDLENSRFRGASFEGFIIEEILRGLACVQAFNIKQYYYRTRGGAEVDLVLEGSFGLLPIEIKCSTNTSISDVKNLSDFINREKAAFGMVVNLSDKVQLLSEKIICIPASLI